MYAFVPPTCLPRVKEVRQRDTQVSGQRKCLPKVPDSPPTVLSANLWPMMSVQSKTKSTIIRKKNSLYCFGHVRSSPRQTTSYHVKSCDNIWKVPLQLNGFFYGCFNLRYTQSPEESSSNNWYEGVFYLTDATRRTNKRSTVQFYTNIYVMTLNLYWVVLNQWSALSIMVITLN